MERLFSKKSAGAKCSAVEQKPFEKRVSPKNQKSRGNKINTIILLGVIFLFASCRAAYYAPPTVYNNKLPAVNPEIDWLSIETFFADGTTHTSSSSYGKTKSTYSVNAANGNNTGVRSQNWSVSNSESTYVKNPQIKALRDIFIKETFGVSEQFDKQQGSIVWSVEFYDRYQKGEGASKALLGVTLGVGGIFYLFGVPWCSYTGKFAVKADILDKDKNYVASYKSEIKQKKYYVAMWWGYKKATAQNMAFYNSLNEAIKDLKSKIMSDRRKITEQLNK